MGPRTHSTFLAALLLLPASATAQGAERRLLHAASRAGSIQIDGRLDEADWERAEPSRDFVERLPRPRARPPVDTEVRVLVDSDSIYVAVTSFLAPGERPRALELTRDSWRIWNDDAVTLKFDVRLDRRTTVGFGVNPAGAQVDFIALDNGRTFQREYDAVWECAAQTLDDRWIAEFRIPAAALRLPPGSRGRIFGFNVSRDHNALQATYDWSHLPPEFGPAMAQRYGDLDGVEGIGSGRPLILLPYFLGALRQAQAETPEWELRAGADARLRLADDIWGEVTLLTDFAEVDLDSQVVNLDRFPLFFPERRPFFLSGLDVFAFGATGEAQLFFTRRIGLDANADPLRMHGGIKVYGREGPFSFGILDVSTAASEGTPAANFGVARLRANLGEASYVGALFGSRVYHGNAVDPSPHWSAGLDGLVRTDDGRIEVSGFAAFTAREGEDSSWGFAGRGEIRYRGEEWVPRLSALFLQSGFEPELGFLRRPAIFQLNATVPFIARTPFEGVRRYQLQATGRIETSDDFEQLLRVSGGWAAELATTDQWVVRVNAFYVQDVVREAFDLVDGLPIAEGLYRGASMRVRLTAPDARNPTFSIDAEARNGFFGGTVYRSNLSLGAAFGPHFRASVGATGALLEFPNRNIIPTLAVNSVFSVTPSPWVVVDLVGQVNTVAERFIGMARLRWRYLPGSDLFIVYRENLDWATLTSERRVTLKVSYRYDAIL